MSKRRHFATIAIIGMLLISGCSALGIGGDNQQTETGAVPQGDPAAGGGSNQEATEQPGEDFDYPDGASSSGLDTPTIRSNTLDFARSNPYHLNLTKEATTPDRAIRLDSITTFANSSAIYQQQSASTYYAEKYYEFASEDVYNLDREDQLESYYVTSKSAAQGESDRASQKIEPVRQAYLEDILNAHSFTQVGVTTATNGDTLIRYRGGLDRQGPLTDIVHVNSVSSSVANIWIDTEGRIRKLNTTITGTTNSGGTLRESLTYTQTMELTPSPDDNVQPPGWVSGLQQSGENGGQSLVQFKATDGSSPQIELTQGTVPAGSRVTIVLIGGSNDQTVVGTLGRDLQTGDTLNIRSGSLTRSRTNGLSGAETIILTVDGPEGGTVFEGRVS